MAAKQSEARSLKSLKGVFKVSGKLHDVCLDEEEIVWTLQGSEHAGKAYNVSTKSMKLLDVIGAWIAKRRSPNKQQSEGQLVGFTLFTFAKAGNRKLSEARVTFECDDVSICEEWIEKINDVIQGFHERPHKLKVIINPRSKNGQARLVYLKQVAPLFDRAGITADIMRWCVLAVMALYMKLSMDSWRSPIGMLELTWWMAQCPITSLHCRSTCVLVSFLQAQQK